MSKKILIVEDEPMISQDLKIVVESLGYEVVGTADNAHDALIAYQKQQPDLVFLDVQIKGEKDGIEIAQALKQIGDTPFIFLTSFFDDDTVYRIRQEEPAAYIVKPFKDSDIKVNLGLAFNQNKAPVDSSDSPSELFVRKNGDLKRVLFEDVVWIKGEDNYSVINCSNGESYTISQTLKSIESKFKDAGFIRVQKSYVVRISAISSISGNSIFIADQVFPIGKAYRKDFFNKITVL